MTKRALLLVAAVALLTGGPRLIDRVATMPDAIAIARRFPRTPQTDGSVKARLQSDIAALESFRPGYQFWQHIFRIPDGYIAFGSAADGRLLAVFPVGGDWKRQAKWSEPSLANALKWHDLPNDLDERRDYVARLFEKAVGPVLHNPTRGRFVNAREYGSFLAEWGTIYERFGVPAEIGLAQAVIESGLDGTRRSEADAVGLCQWLDGNWDHLDRLAPEVIEAANQTTQAAYCAAYISILATKYGSFIPALSAHHAGGTNVGRVLVNGARLGAPEPREQYFLGAELARALRSIGDEYSDIYASYGPRSYRYAEMIFGNTFTVRSIVASNAQRGIYAMRVPRPTPLAEIAKRTRLSTDEIKRFNPSLVKTVPAGATLYLPTFDRAFGRDVTFWHRPASDGYAAVLDAFVRIKAAPEDWDQPSFERTFREFERRFRATKTEEGAIMATVLAYVRLESLSSPRRNILAEFENSEEIRDLFERGLHEPGTVAALLAE